MFEELRIELKAAEQCLAEPEARAMAAQYQLAAVGDP